MNIIGSIWKFLLEHFDTIIAALSLGIASIMLYLNSKALKEQNRPYVSFSLEKNPQIHNDILLIIRNTGNRIAENVLINTTPNLYSCSSEKLNIDYSHFKTNPIKFDSIAPNQIIKTSFDHSLHLFNKKNTNNKILHYNVHIKYKCNRIKYSQSYEIDISYFRNLATTISPDNINKNIKQIADSIKKISKKIGN